MAAVLIVKNISTADHSEVITITYSDLFHFAKKEVDCLADNIYYEARAEPISGQYAVAFVTMNRVHSDIFPTTICDVVKERTTNTCQFSWWCDESITSNMNRKDKNGSSYRLARKIALDVYLNYHKIYDNTYGALFYHADYLTPKHIGVKGLKMTKSIGGHVFYTF